MGKRISSAKRAALSPVVSHLVREACREQAPTPTYADMVKACRDAGLGAAESEMSTILGGLIADGDFRRSGAFYQTDEGTTVARSRAAYIGRDAPIRSPTMEERAAWYGVPLQMRHPSEREVRASDLPARPFTSHAGRWASPLS